MTELDDLDKQNIKKLRDELGISVIEIYSAYRDIKDYDLTKKYLKENSFNLECPGFLEDI